MSTKTGDFDPGAHIYRVGDTANMPDADPQQVGNKASNLIRMTRIGLPVPVAIVLGTELCRNYLESGKRVPGLGEALAQDLAWIQDYTDTRLGDWRRPLLLSVRSGAAASMPGMMETVLNIGMNDKTVRGVIRMTGNARLAWDCYRRLIQSYCEVVHGARPDNFDRVVDHYIEAQQLSGQEELDTHTLEAICNEFLGISAAIIGKPFPQDPAEQLQQAIYAVFNSWMSDKAVKYRQLNGLEHLTGTAVTIQNMVFGNAGVTSGSGVGFTRDPATGENSMYIDFLFNAQGEDVVSGRRTVRDAVKLQDLMPALYRQLEDIKERLEKEYRDMQDFEFTVQDNHLYMLQTRIAKRTPLAAVQVAVDLVNEQLVDSTEAQERLRGIDTGQLKQQRLVPSPGTVRTGQAVPASIGVAVGAAALSAERAIRMADAGEPVVLVRRDMTTEDIAGLAVAEGIVSVAGFRTSHAAVVARQLGKVCLVGCSELDIDDENKAFTLGDQTFSEGDYLSLDGQSGAIYAGKQGIEQAEPSRALQQIRSWEAAQQESVSLNRNGSL